MTRAQLLTREVTVDRLHVELLDRHSLFSTAALRHSKAAAIESACYEVADDALMYGRNLLTVITGERVAKFEHNARRKHSTLLRQEICVKTIGSCKEAQTPSKKTKRRIGTGSVHEEL